MGRLPCIAMAALAGGLTAFCVPAAASAHYAPQDGKPQIKTMADLSGRGEISVPTEDTQCIAVKDWKILTPNSVIVRDEAGAYYHLSLSGSCDGAKDHLDAVLNPGRGRGAQTCLAKGESFKWASTGAAYTGLDNPVSNYAYRPDFSDPLKSRDSRASKALSTCVVVNLKQLSTGP